MPKSAEYMDLPFNEAIDYFRQKVKLPTRTWKDLWQGMHARSFVVAGAMKTELLEDLYAAVDKGVSEGTTLKEFRKDFDALVDRHGWKYKGGKGWRTGVIFNTNLSTAYAAGQHAQMTDPAVMKARPYWRYVASSSRNPRPEHQAWYNTVLPADDPWWNTHRPPNGWGCKCGVVNHSAREVKRLKKEEAGGDQPIKTEAPEIEHYEWTDKTTGKVHRIPKGIDPGWDYNVGEAAWGRNQALRLMEDHGPWIDVNPRGPENYGRSKKIEIDAAKAKPFAPQKTEAGLYSSLRKVLNGDEAVFFDPVGEAIAVNQAIVDHILQAPGTRWDGREDYFPLIPELIEDPYEIWIGFAKSELSGRVAIRRRYVKMVQIGKTRTIGLWAETMKHMWVASGFFRGGPTAANNLRRGRMLYGRD